MNNLWNCVSAGLCDMEVFLLAFYVRSKNKKHLPEILVLPCVFAIINLLLVFISVEDSPTSSEFLWLEFMYVFYKEIHK